MSAIPRSWPSFARTTVALAALLALGAYLWQELAREGEPFSRLHLILIIGVLLFIRLLFHYEGRIRASSLRELLFHNRALLPIPLLIIALLATDGDLPGGPVVEHLILAGALLLLVAGHSLRIWAIGHAGRQTRTTALLVQRLATSGPYSYVRNPIYLGNLLIALGMLVVANVPWLSLLGMGVLCLHYWLVVAAEEASLRGQFGEEYERYLRSVPRFRPRLRPQNDSQGTFDRTIWRSKEYQAWLASTSIVALLLLVQRFVPN